MNQFFTQRQIDYDRVLNRILRAEVDGGPRSNHLIFKDDNLVSIENRLKAMSGNDKAGRPATMASIAC